MEQTKFSAWFTMGDPRGVGPDVILMAAAELGEEFSPVVVGSRAVLEERARMLGTAHVRRPHRGAF
jgi:4-hydroxy-L-threonine phosphate dehydrogenase PdxA